MIAPPKFILIILVIFAVWYAMRWFNRSSPNPRTAARGGRSGRARRRPAPSPPPAIEDLVACRVCGAYVAADARGCGKPGCPQPR